MRVGYLVHDLCDPATRRRVRMLRAGGADVALAGFHRLPAVPTEIEGVRPQSLGRTHDARFMHRALSVGRVLAGRAGALRQGFGEPDVIVARNLEMLTIAAALRRAAANRPNRPRLVYECLDLHRKLVAEDGLGQLLRRLERHLLRGTSLILTSSPAFVTNHFARYRDDLPPIRLVENKVLGEDGGSADRPRQRTGEPARGDRPWRIGWFGAIRCERSLTILTELARRMAGAVQVVIRGRPAETAIPGFAQKVAAAPHVAFFGSYRNPEDLPAIYGDVDFAWTIDFFEEGLNSAWLLPNRLYEGGLYGAVPIALAPTETGRFLARRQAGLVVDDVSPDHLAHQLRAMTRERWSAMSASIEALPRTTWICTRAECQALVTALGGGRHPQTAVALGVQA